MYNETKEALEKAFQIGKILFGLGEDRYSKLLIATNDVATPTKEDLKEYITKGMIPETALAIELKKRYIYAAKTAGFRAEHGIAMLKYTAMLKEMRG